MGLVIKLQDIVSPNQFKVYYKGATSPYPINSGYSLYGTFAAGTTTVNVSGVTLNFNSSYWFKIEDQTTGRYIIENIETNDPIAYMDCCPQPVGLSAICYHSCYPPTINSIDCLGEMPPTATPTPTPTPTATPTGPTATPTPTPTATPTLPGCGSTITGSYGPSNNTVQTYNLDFSIAPNGSTISVHYTANERPDKFSIRENGLSIVATSGWAGSDYGYSGPWSGSGISDPDGDGYISFTYNSSSTYELVVDVGPANPSNPLSDSWTVTFSCLGAPTSTPTPTPTATPVSTTKFIVKKCVSSGGDGVTSYKVQIAPNATVGKSYTLFGSGAPADMDGYNCWYVESTVTDSTLPDYSLNYNGEYADCGLCSSVELVVYSGSSLVNACSSPTQITLYYRGTLGVGTVLYTDSNLATLVETPGYYLGAYSDQVYHVGVASQYPYIPSPEDGYVTDIQYCPTPTPTPTQIPPNPMVHVYELCPEGSGQYYWNYGISASRAIDLSNNCYIRQTSTTALLSDQQMVYPSLTYNPDLEPSDNIECPCA